MPSKPDPIGDLFAKPTPQPPAPAVATAPSVTTKATGGGWSGMLLALALFGGLWYASANDLIPHWGKGDGQKQEEKQEQKADPKLAGCFIVFVEETNDRYKFPHLAIVQSDKAWADKMKAAGLTVAWYDVDAKEIIKWRPDAEKAGLPALLVIDPKGKVIKAKTAPPTVESVEEFVFKGGAK